MLRYRRRLAMALLALVPLVVVPAVGAWSVGPLGRMGARILGAWSSWVPAAPAMQKMDPDDAVSWLDAFTETETDAIRSAWQTASVGDDAAHERTIRHRHAPVQRKLEHRIFVSREMIRRALPTSARPAATWTARTDDHPAGIVVTSPGALGGTLRSGDILYEGQGRILTSMGHLVAIVTDAYQHRVPYLSGRLWRRGEIWAVTVEPGWIVESAHGDP